MRGPCTDVVLPARQAKYRLRNDHALDRPNEQHDRVLILKRKDPFEPVASLLSVGSPLIKYSHEASKRVIICGARARAACFFVDSKKQADVEALCT